MVLLNRTNFDAVNTELSSDFQGFLSEAARVRKAKSDWRSFTKETQSKAADMDYGWMGELPKLERWVGQRRVYGLEAKKYTIVNEKWSTAISIAREDLEDDTLGNAKDRISDLAYAAERGWEEQAFLLLKNGDTGICFDEGAFFATHTVNGASVPNQDTGGSGPYWYLVDSSQGGYKPCILQHRDKPELQPQTSPESDHVWDYDEYRYGVRARFGLGYGFWQTAFRSNQTCNGSFIEAAAEAMMAFTDDKGKPLGIFPDTLVVTPANWAEGNLLYVAETISSTSNPHKGKFRVVVSQWLA